MPATQDERPRARNGRFVKKRGTAAKASADRTVDAGAVPRPESLAQLSLLTLAIVLAVLGFALSLLWVGALVLMGILWGVMVAERRQQHGTVKGLAAELVTTVVDEAKGVMEATSGSDPDSESSSSSSRPPDRKA
jgi:hypothetical protein